MVTAANGNISTATQPADPKTGHSVFGASTFYPFSITLSPNDTVPSSFSIDAGSSRLDNLTLENRVFFLPGLASVVPTSEDGLVDVIIVAAGSKTLELDVIEGAVTLLLAQPGSNSLTLKPTTTSIPLTLANDLAVKSLNQYHLYSGTIHGVNQTLLRQASVDIIASQGSERIVDEFNRLASLLGS